jgi:hypothetical protein
MDNVPFFIRFSEELVEDARSIGMSLFQESSHKTVENCIQKCLGPEADENNDEDDDDENDGRMQQRGHGTRSLNESPDADDRDGPASGRSSTRLLEKAKPGRPTPSEVRAKMSQMKTENAFDEKLKMSQMKTARAHADASDEKLVIMSDKVKLDNMRLKADGNAQTKAVR